MNDASERELLLQVLRGIDEVKSRVGAIEFQVDGLNQKFQKQNGRVDRLEEWKEKVLLREADAAGFERGTADTLISRKQVLQIGALATAAAGITGLVAPLIARMAS